MKSMHCVVATCPNRGIGFKGELPWPRLKEDMARFVSLTKGVAMNAKQNAVIMGRLTWESIPEKFKPLDGRKNIVLSSQGNSTAAGAHEKAALWCKNLDEAIAACDQDEEVQDIFVIGGARVYEEAMAHNRCCNLYVTRVGKQFECDTFLPEIVPSQFSLLELSKTMASQHTSLDFAVYKRCGGVADTAPTPARSECSSANGTTTEPEKKPAPTTTDAVKEGIMRTAAPTVVANPLLKHEEYQYLDLIKDIVESGFESGDRTGTGIVSKFGCQMRFSLQNDVFPLLTTKRVFWRGVAEELLWFIKGDTNAKNLSDKKIHIWDGNGSKEFLEGRGLGHREEGDLGPVYGFQWRHFGAEYKDMHADYEGQGVDQIKEVIHALKTNPTDRRMIVTAWNPTALKDMALPPCHMMAQFYVGNGELSCLLYQRSCDMGLGVPFNIASYALLTRLLAQVTGLKAGELVHCMGNTHVYSNHIKPLMEEQVDRTPRPFPLLKINPAKTDIDSFEFSDFELVGYNPDKKIQMQMAV